MLVIIILAFIMVTLRVAFKEVAGVPAYLPGEELEEIGPNEAPEDELGEAEPNKAPDDESPEDDSPEPMASDVAEGDQAGHKKLGWFGRFGHKPAEVTA